MPTQDQAASGPAEGNAGEASTRMSLGDAITAVLDRETKGGNAPPSTEGDIADELTNPAVAKLAAGNKQKAGAGSTGDEPHSEDAAAAPEGAEGDKPEAAPKEGDAKELSAPKHWTEARKQAFAKLPSDGQKTLLEIARDLEGGFTRKSQELSDKAKFTDTVRGLFDETTRAQLRRAGTDEAGAIQYLLRQQQFATKDPVAYVKWAMQSLGVTPDHIGSPQTKADGQVAGQPGPQTQQPAVSTGDAKLDELLADPAVKQLGTELAEAKKMIADQQRLLGDVAGRMSARERAEHEYLQSQQQQATQVLQHTISSFRSTLDESGQLAFPHFDQVYRQMGAIMDTDPRISQMPDGPEKMAAAYHKVVRGDPEFSQSIIDAEVAKRMAAERKKSDTERAKRAAAVKPASGAPTQKVRTNSLDDAISGAFTSRGL